MDRGYIKLWRKTLDSGWIKNHKLWAVWSWCLLKATRFSYDQIVGCQTVRLEPGQFVFGRNAGALETGLSVQSFRTCVEQLSRSKNLTIKSTNKYSIITIINWDTYQSPQASNQPTEQPVSNQQLTSNQPATNHKQEVKNLRSTEKAIQKHSAFAPQNAADGNGECIITRRKRKLTGKRLDAFLQFWEAFSYKKGRAEAADAWMDIPQLTNAELAKIIEAAKQEAAVRSKIIAEGRTPKMAQGWISGRRWEDEHLEAQAKRYSTGRF